MAGSRRASFDVRMRQLAEQVGHGTLRGELVRDQAYAKYQHERTDLRHPDGGQAKYQENALYAGHTDWLGYLAGNVLHGDLEDAMRDVVEEWDADVRDRVPVETFDLALSGAPTVRSQGRVVWSRPPAVPRRDRDTTPGDDRGGNRRGPG